MSSIEPVVAAADLGTWLHGVVRDAGAEVLAATVGMAGTPVRAVRAAGLAAVVSTVPLTEYGEEALRRNLEDLAWLERAARAHHAVVAALAQAGPVVPARLATVHHGDDRVAALLATRRAELAAVLDRLAGRDEWGVKGYVVPGATPRAAEPAGAGGAGAAYLRRRRAQLTAREEGQRVAGEAAAAVHAELAGHAVAARRHPPQDRRLSGAATAMVLNGAYLVDTGALAAFTELVRALGERHPEIRLELTGPWPPYSFVADGPEEPAHTVREPAW